MSNIYNWDVIAANNANADSAIDWAEGMSPANVNDSARVMMGRVKELLIDIGGSIVATGTANVIAASTQSAFTTLANGRMLSFRAIATNSQATTLNVNAIGAKPVLKATGSGIVALTGREIQAGGMYSVQYSTDLNSGNGAWLLLNPTSAAIPAGAITDFAGATVPDGWLLCYGQNVSRTTYADLFTAIGTTYSAGDGSTTFGLPDYRGRVGAGRDNMGGSVAGRLNSITSGGVDGSTLSAAGGEQAQTLLISQMPSHNHGGSTGSGGAFEVLTRTSLVAAFLQGTGNAVWNNNFFQAYPEHLHTIPAQGGGAPHNNVQPTIVTNKIIKF